MTTMVRARASQPAREPLINAAEPARTTIDPATMRRGIDPRPIVATAEQANSTVIVSTALGLPKVRLSA